MVHSTPEKGGTWAGAIENIKKKFSLPFIWVEKGVAEGNLELTRKGAIPLTKDCLYPQAKFRQWLKEQREIWDNDLKSTQEPQKSIKVNEKNCFKKSEQLELFPDFPVH